MNNADELKGIISEFANLPPSQIDLTAVLKNYYVADIMKLNFCSRLRNRWPELHTSTFVNDMFVSIKTGQHVLDLIPKQIT